MGILRFSVPRMRVKQFEEMGLTLLSTACFLLIDLPSMSYGNDGNDELAIVDLIDGAVVADADAPGLATP